MLAQCPNIHGKFHDDPSINVDTTGRKLRNLAQLRESPAGGCTSYDVITPWPDMTRSIFLLKDAQRMTHIACKISASYARLFSVHLGKILGEVDTTPLPVRGLTHAGRCSYRNTTGRGGGYTPSNSFQSVADTSAKRHSKAHKKR